MKNFIQLPVILGIILSFPTSGYAEPDNIKPSCEATFVGVNTNNEKFAQFTAHDNKALLNITVTEMVNSTSTVYFSKFYKKKTRIFRATKIDQTQKAIIEAEVSDTAGNVSNCSHAIIVKITDNGKSIKNKYPSIPHKAGSQVIVHVQNGAPGIDNLKIVVNGIKQETTLSNGEYKTIDVSSSMQDGNDNIISFKGKGDPDSRAYIIIYQN